MGANVGLNFDYLSGETPNFIKNSSFSGPLSSFPAILSYSAEIQGLPHHKNNSGRVWRGNRSLRSLSWSAYLGIIFSFPSLGGKKASQSLR
jgi:hypothetical protein